VQRLLKLKQKPVPCIVRVHCHMCAALPAADDNGLLDPYLRLSYKNRDRYPAGHASGLGGKPVETRRQYDTRDPSLHQSFDFDVVLRNDLSTAPPVAVSYWW
jgi:hypothetical protein